MKTYYTIYKTTNLINNRYYIGKHITKDLHDNYYGSGSKIKSAIKKHGLINFKKEILFIFDNENDMNLREIELVNIDLINDRLSYNIVLGGKGGNIVLYKEHPKYKEVCDKISKSVKGMRHWTNGTDEIRGFDCPYDGWYIGRLDNTNFKHSDERRMKMSESYSSGKMKWWNNGVINKRNYEPPNDGSIWVSGRLLDKNSKFLSDKDYSRKYNYAIVQDTISGEIIKISYINKEYENYGKGFRQNMSARGKYKNYKLIEFILNPNTKRK